MLMMTTTEALEEELAKLSASLDADAMKLTDNRARFQSLAAELKNRRLEKDEQPTPTDLPVSVEDALRRDNERLRREMQQLSLKITSMEGEQAKLIIEAETERQLRLEEQERLALVVKHFNITAKTITK